MYSDSVHRPLHALPLTVNTPPPLRHCPGNACLAFPHPRSSYHVADTSVVTGRPLSRVPALGVTRRAHSSLTQPLTHGWLQSSHVCHYTGDNDLWFVIERRKRLVIAWTLWALRQGVPVRGAQRPRDQWPGAEWSSIRRWATPFRRPFRCRWRGVMPGSAAASRTWTAALTAWGCTYRPPPGTRKCPR